MAMQDDISLLLYQAGFGNQYVTMANKRKVIQCILFHQVFRASRDQIVDLMDVLNTLDILELLRANNACLSLVFPLHSEVNCQFLRVMCLPKLSIYKTNHNGKRKWH